MANTQTALLTVLVACLIAWFGVQVLRSINRRPTPLQALVKAVRRDIDALESDSKNWEVVEAEVEVSFDAVAGEEIKLTAEESGGSLSLERHSGNRLLLRLHRKFPPDTTGD